MTKAMTDSARERERQRKEIYGEWKKMKKVGYSRRTAIPVLAADYGLSIKKVERMLTTSDQLEGIMPKRSVSSNELHQEVWDKFVELRNEGYSWYNACDQLGKQYGKHWQTITNWMREIKNREHSNI